MQHKIIPQNSHLLNFIFLFFNVGLMGTTAPCKMDMEATPFSTVIVYINVNR